MSLDTIGEWKSFDGRQVRVRHRADVLGCDMTFSVYLPPAVRSGPVPVVYWLSGLTCTDENFVTKAGAQQFASEYGLAIVAPDTSPRGEHVPDDPDGAYDFGLGAGFYLNATEAPWSEHYKMYDYVTQELPALIEAEFPVDAERVGVFGHSMGGHGALTIGLKNPVKYKSISAFAPICSPVNCPWGEKALGSYLGADKSAWADYDAAALVARAEDQTPLFVDQGLADEFLDEQLRPELLEEACRDTNHPLVLRRHDGYDHSYFFIASFMQDHIHYHAEQLGRI